VVGAAEAAGVRHYIIEHDNPKSIDDLAASYQYLKKLSF
jgi:hypothetical protein